MGKTVIDAEDTKLLYSAGFTSTAIGQLMGVSHNIVLRTLREAGVFIRPRHWKGGKHLMADGYVFVRRPNHPRAIMRGYVMRAIVNWEAANSRPFPADKFPHHKNEVKTDDRPENIEPVTRPEHASIHMKRRHAHARQVQQRDAVKNNGVNQKRRHNDRVGAEAGAGGTRL